MYRSLRALRAFPLRCDLYLAGSDQLWNTKLTDGKLDPAYALDFGPEGTRRATYAVGCYFSDPAAAGVFSAGNCVKIAAANGPTARLNKSETVNQIGSSGDP